MYRLVTAVLLAMLAAGAWAFPIDLDLYAGGNNVATRVHSDGRVAIIEVVNNEAFALRCEALFRNGPERGRTRRAIVAPGASASLTWTPRRNVVRLRAELYCEPHDAPYG
jgi:hypothetical protein